MGRLITLGALAAVTAFRVVFAAVFATALPAAADDYPNRPIVLVIPLPPGGTNDILARAVSDKMSAALGQQIVIENRNAGGSGTAGTRLVAHAAPDGYTIILGYTSTLATGPNLLPRCRLRSAQRFCADRVDRVGSGAASGLQGFAGCTMSAN